MQTPRNSNKRPTTYSSGLPSSSGQAAPSFPHVLSRQESVMSNGTMTSLDERFEALTKTSTERELEQDAKVANAKKQQMAEEDRGKMADKIVTDVTSKHHHNLKKDLGWTEEQKEEHNTNSWVLTQKRSKLLNWGETFTDGCDVGKYTEYQDGALVMTMDYMSNEDTTDDEAKMMTREKKGLNVKKPAWHSKCLNDFYDMLDKDHGGNCVTAICYIFIHTNFFAPSSSASSLLPAPSSPIPSPSDPSSSSSSLLAVLRHGF
ncbi:hypothetical protein BDA99DRAFT_566887 [Phascolomyces articulosus]|uniref:Uncharacterized protein n=1 Tax=Phascolomyces articulosus TaxID=60185 RepID=A0AAD5JVN2_9FUNG|nr:hypothetical protein BDA99DRAFT_566887 [Phascolomyces articulosus]